MTIAELPIVSHWDYKNNIESPDSIAAKSNNKKYWWLCPDCGKSFPRTPLKMSIGTCRCKDCGSKYRANIRYASLLKYRKSVADIPEVAVLFASEYNDRKASEVLSMSDRKYKFHCKNCGALFERQTKNVTLGQYYCDNCTQERRRNSYLKTRYEKHETCAQRENIIKIWDYEMNAAEEIYPDKLTAHSKREIHLLCPVCGKRWRDFPDARYDKQPMCPDCGNKRAGKANKDRALIANGSAADADSRILKYWHPTKNGNSTPYDYTRNAPDVCVFLCELGHEYEMPIVDFINRLHPCPICKPGSHTSFAEKVIAYYLSKIVEVIENYRILELRMEFDIWIPTMNTAIEYDGSYYHKGRENRDRKKDIYCAENKIRLVRVKECKENVHGQEGIHYDFDSMNYQWLMDVICDELNIPHIVVDMVRDTPDIYAKVRYSNLKNSIALTRPDVDRLWDLERNKNIKTYDVAQFSRQKFFWRCPDCGSTWSESPFEVCGRKYPCKVCGLKKRGRKAMPLTL